MQAGSWKSIGLIYLYGVLGACSLSKFIPLQADFADLGATPATFGILMSLLAVPSALLSTVGGALVDRVGARRTLLCAALIGVAANACYLAADSLRTFQIIRVCEGFTIIGFYSAAPALIMGSTVEPRRTQAMAFWSTYAPTGTALGLLLAGFVAGTLHWRMAFGAHGVLLLMGAVATFLLPATPPAPPAARRGAMAALAGLFATYKETGPLRVALGFGAVIMVGLGMSTVFPAWYFRYHQLPVAAASVVLAAAYLAMIAGGGLTTMLLGRGVGIRTLFISLFVVACLSGTVVFHPGSSLVTGLSALTIWLLVSGAASAAVLSLLPRVVRDPSRAGGAAGLLSQMGAISSFMTPPLWLAILARGQWTGFALLIIVVWILLLVVAPIWGRAE